MDSKVTLKQLEVFVAVAEELSFGRAALRLHLSQPPITRLIQSLEESLGTRLFDRNKRQVSLTSAGLSLLHEARHILGTVSSGVETVQAVSRGEAGSVIIGFEGMAVFDLIPRSIRAFQKQYPRVEVALREMPSSEQVSALHDRRIHLGFAAGMVRDRKLQTEVIASEPYVLILPKSHPLAESDDVPLRRLAQETFLMCPREHNPTLYDQLILMCDSAGFRPKLIPAPGDAQLILSFIAEGIGIAVGPQSLADLSRRGVVTKKLKPALPSSQLTMILRKGEDAPALKRFLQIVSKTRKAVANGIPSEIGLNGS